MGSNKHQPNKSWKDDCNIAGGSGIVICLFPATWGQKKMCERAWKMHFWDLQQCFDFELCVLSVKESNFNEKKDKNFAYGQGRQGWPPHPFTVSLAVKYSFFLTTCLRSNLGRTDWFKFGSFSLDSFRKYLKICSTTGVSKIFNEAQLKIFLLDQLGRRLLLHPVPLNPTSDYKDPTALVDFFLDIFKSFEHLIVDIFK